MADAASLAPAAPDARLRDLIATAGELIRVLGEETAALGAFKLGRIAEFAETKRKLSEAYAVLVRGLRKEPELLAAANAAVRDELKETLARFDVAARANERTLAAARAANERVLKTVVEAAETRRGGATGAYSRTGGVARPGARAGALSLAFDRRL
jgi:hypothetical protein